MVASSWPSSRTTMTTPPTSRASGRATTVVTFTAKQFAPNPAGKRVIGEREEKAMKEFLSDVKELRRRARQRLEQGPVTDGYKADPKKVIAVLNEALATELVCVLRYKRHYHMASGIHAEPVAKEFLQHAHEEQLHADRIAQRITQLQGEPDFDPEGLATRSHSEYIAGDSLVEMIREDLVAERIA